MKLHYARFTRAARPRWMLEELGLPYELLRLDLSKGDQRSPTHLAFHPHGKVPALEVDGLVMIESAAMVHWLADRHPEAGLAPAAGTVERALYEQWMFYAMASAEPPIEQYFAHTRRLPEDKRDPRLAEDAKGKVRQVADVVTRALAGREHLLGAFSAADIVLGSVMIWARSMKLLEEFPVVLAWCDRLQARPAFKRAHAD